MTGRFLFLFFYFHFDFDFDFTFLFFSFLFFSFLFFSFLFFSSFSSRLSREDGFASFYPVPYTARPYSVVRHPYSNPASVCKTGRVGG